MAPAKKPGTASKPPKPKGKAASAKTTRPLRTITTAAPALAPAKVATAKPASPDVTASDPSLFDPLTPGETADALRTLTEDKRLSSMVKVGRYRIIVTEPLVVKPPHWMAGHRLARVVAYDYAHDRGVDACIDLDAGVVAHLEISKAQPMLSPEEEALAIQIASVDARIRAQLGIGDGPQLAMHYWGRNPTDLAYQRRSAAVVFGRADGMSTIVAVVDLLDNLVTQVVPAELW